MPSFADDRSELEVYRKSEQDDRQNPVLYFSSAQIDILSLSIFLAQALQPKRVLMNTIFMDDSINHMDSINVLSFIDLIRSITTNLGRNTVNQQ